jgi:hypothetical protein
MDEIEIEEFFDNNNNNESSFNINDKLCSVINKNEKYYLIPNKIDSINQKNYSWLVYKGNIFPKSRNKYKLKEGDIIRVGRIWLIIREINFKNNKNLNESNTNLFEIFDENLNSNNNKNKNNKFNKDEEKENLEIQKEILENIKDEYEADDIHIYKNLTKKNKENFIFKNILQNKQSITNFNENDQTKSINSLTKSFNLNEELILNNKNKNTILNTKKKISVLNNNNVNQKLLIKLNNYKIKPKKKLCRICYLEEDDSNNPLIKPCKCTGSLKYIHINCLLHWIKTKNIIKKINFTQSETFTIYLINNIECELCKTVLPEYFKHKNKIFSLLNFDNFANNEINNNKNNTNNNKNEDYIIFDNYLPDKNNNKYRYIVKFTKSKEVSIGRGFEAQLILNDISVSRLHCKINITEKGEILLNDLNSKFGTLVLIQNPELEILKKFPLSIQIGRTLITFNYKKNFCLFGCCNVDEKDTSNKTYENLNSIFVHSNKKNKIITEIDEESSFEYEYEENKENNEIDSNNNSNLIVEKKDDENNKENVKEQIPTLKINNIPKLTIKKKNNINYSQNNNEDNNENITTGRQPNTTYK